MLRLLMGIDQNMVLWIQNNIRNDFLNPVIIWITRLGDGGRIWIIISLILIVIKKTRKTGFLMLIALGLSYMINNLILKNLIARARPYETIEGLSSLIGIQSDFSFPSGHTGSSFAGAGVLLCSPYKKWCIFAMILAVLIGFSRLYVGVHYPTDVLCGAMSGMGIAFFTWMIGSVLIHSWYYFPF